MRLGGLRREQQTTRIRQNLVTTEVIQSEKDNRRGARGAPCDEVASPNRRDPAERIRSQLLFCKSWRLTRLGNVVNQLRHG
jgi:hypothetical protein